MHAKNSSNIIRNIIDVILILVIIALAVTNYLTYSQLRSHQAYIIYTTPESQIKSGPYITGSLVKLESGPEIDGYNFIGWRDADGNIQTENEIYVNEDTYFSAIYSVGFDKDSHIVYLENVNGLFRPYDPITRSECAEMFYKLMNNGKTGKGTFKDVQKSDSYYTACATLKDLGVFHGNYFHPNDSVSRKEFAEMLSCFIQDYETYMDNVVSDEYLKRCEVAVIMNNILGRHGDSNHNAEKVGTFMDLSENSEFFWDVAEATIEHTFSINDGKEVWITSKSLPSYEPGLFFVGSKLHYIDENGNPIINGEALGLFFNEQGEETSGDAEVDEAIRAILTEVIDFDKMDQSDMVRALFDYVAAPDNYEYLTRNYYDYGDTSWVLDEAKIMLQSGRGNCYNFAAVYYYLLRAIGCNPQIYSGTMGPDDRPHAWIEMEKKGQMYLYDVEYKYANPNSNTFQRDQTYMDRYRYRKQPRTEKSA